MAPGHARGSASCMARAPVATPRWFLALGHEQSGRRACLGEGRPSGAPTGPRSCSRMRMPCSDGLVQHVREACRRPAGRRSRIRRSASRRSSIVRGCSGAVDGQVEHEPVARAPLLGKAIAPGGGGFAGVARSVRRRCGPRRACGCRARTTVSLPGIGLDVVDDPVFVAIARRPYVEVRETRGYRAVGAHATRRTRRAPVAARAG